MSKQPRFPIYIPTKGRAELGTTTTRLAEMSVPHFLVVEPQEQPLYEKTKNEFATVLPMDMQYKQTYELCDTLGLSKSTGAGPARNFAWDHAIRNGYTHHWVMDDNIRHFQMFLNRTRIRCRSSTFWYLMETFVLQYQNVAMAGPAYDFFTIPTTCTRPFTLNTRIYSCNLIKNDLPFRWRGRYNEDTILSLDILKAGWCTVQFNAFLQGKLATQKMPGGNTTELYQQGTQEKSEMLKRVYPQYTKLVERYGRPHHHVNYGVFKTPLVRAHGAPAIDAKLVLKTRNTTTPV